MEREKLAKEAREAGLRAAHNLKVIRKYPEKLLPGAQGNAEAYLNMMIQFSEEEMKSARRAGRTLGLRTRLKLLVASILRDDSPKRKGEPA